MATFITGAFVCVGLYFALRHVYRNFRSGTSDCAGCRGCSGGSCHHCAAEIPDNLARKG